MQNVEKVLWENKEEITRNIAEEYCINPVTYKIYPMLTETSCNNCKFYGNDGNCRQHMLNWLRSEVGRYGDERESI